METDEHIEQEKLLRLFKGMYQRVVQESFRLLQYGIITSINTRYNVIPFNHYTIEVVFGDFNKRELKLNTAYRQEIIDELLKEMPNINNRVFRLEPRLENILEEEDEQ